MKPPELRFFQNSPVPEIPMTGALVAPEMIAPAEENPDARIFLTDESGRAIAHAALWWKNTPVFDGKKIGTIGGFAASDLDSAKMLLDGAATHLRKAGCDLAVGPMNGNTWRKHRFVIESDGRGEFLLEPRNPLEHPIWWELAGFSILSRYSSSVMRLDEIVEIPAALEKRLDRSGVVVRNLNASRYEDELRAIYSISLKSFSQNFLYTPLDEISFLDAYQKVRNRVDADLVKIAERDGAICGFVFGIPDFEALARGENPAIIVKTLAVDPHARCAGLGSLLVEKLHLSAREKGYAEAIHALQHQTNTSLKITGRHHGKAFRHYALFSKKLTSTCIETIL
jgi:GNAT superfamily N-acetyltransferase